MKNPINNFIKKHNKFLYRWDKEETDTHIIFLPADSRTAARFAKKVINKLTGTTRYYLTDIYKYKYGKKLV